MPAENGNQAMNGAASPSSNAPLPPSPYDAALATARTAALSAVLSEGETDGWVFNSRQQDVDIYLKTVPGSSVNCSKGVGIIDAPMDEIENVFDDQTYRKEWDEICIDARTVKRLDWRTSVVYTAFGAPWPVSARDFLAVGRVEDEPLGPEKSKGVRFHYSTSIDATELVPVAKGRVRGTLHYFALWLEPIPGPRPQTRVIYSLSSDPNGSIPKGIVNAANIKQPLCVANVRKFIQKKPDIVAKMREARKKEDAENEKLMKAYMPKQGLSSPTVAPPAPNGQSASPAASSSPSSAPKAAAPIDPVCFSLDYVSRPQSLPPLTSPSHNDLLHRAYSTALAAVRAGPDEDGWTYNSTQEDVEIFTRKIEGSPIECSKGIGYVDAPPLVVSTLFNSPDWRSQWDGMYAKGEKIEVLDQFTSITYSAFAAPWPVSGRDFCALGRTVLLPSKESEGEATANAGSSSSTYPVHTVFTFSINIDHPNCPPRKPFVRGELMFCGVWVEAVEGQPNRSKVIYTLGSDPKGSIPKGIVNAANVKQPLCISAIRKLLKEKPNIRKEVEMKIEQEKIKSMQMFGGATGAAVSPSTVLLSSSSNPQRLQFDTVCPLLRSAGPTHPASAQPQFVVWDESKHLSTELRQRMHQTREHVTKPVRSFILFMHALMQLILTFIKPFEWKGTKKEDGEHDSDTVNSKLPTDLQPCGAVWLQVADLRQIVATLQSQRIAELGDDDLSSAQPSAQHTLWLHAELDGVPRGCRQGQVAVVKLNLASGEFSAQPSTFFFDIYHPQSSLRLSLYGQSLDIVRNTGTGLDSMSHTVDGSRSRLRSGSISVAPRPSSSSSTPERSRPFVRLSGATLDLDSLTAPCTDVDATSVPTHARLSWVELADEEGWAGGSSAFASTDELMAALAACGESDGADAQRSNGNCLASIGEWSRKKMRRELLSSQSHHPLLQTAPCRTHSILLHSYVLLSRASDLRGQLSLGLPMDLASPRSIIKRHMQGYTILVQALDGTLDMLHLPVEQRAAAMYAYEHLKAGSSLGSSGSAFVAARGSFSAMNGSVAAKLLLDPHGHILHASFADQSAKRSLFSYGAHLIRHELSERMESINSDAPASSRPSTTVSLNEQARRRFHVRCKTILDPRTSFSPFLLVGAWSALLSRFATAIRMMYAALRWSSWTSTYGRVGAWFMFVLLCWQPRLLFIILPITILLSLAHSAAFQHFSHHWAVRHSLIPPHHSTTYFPASTVVEEWDKGTRHAKEKFISLVCHLHQLTSSRAFHAGALQLLFLLQCILCHFSLRTTRMGLVANVHDVWRWRDERSTLAVAIACVWVGVCALILPFRLLMLIVTFSIILRHARPLRTFLNMQADVVLHVKRWRYRQQQLQFPSSTVALQQMEQSSSSASKSVNGA